MNYLQRKPLIDAISDTLDELEETNVNYSAEDLKFIDGLSNDIYNTGDIDSYSLEMLQEIFNIIDHIYNKYSK